MGRFWILEVALALCAAPAFGQQEGDEIDRIYHDIGLAKREKPTLLDLVRRQTCRYPCPNTDTCASTSTDKCCDVGGFCYAWEVCCGGGCISFVQTCCINGNFCDSLEKCCNDSFGGCCDVGYSCNANTGRCSFGGGGGTGGATGNAATPGKATRTATATATATGNRYYYFTITWAYTSWYYNYDFDIRFSTVTSTRVTTSTRTSVFASNAAAASNQFDAMTAFFITPAPPFPATSLSASASQINAARSSSAGARSTTGGLATPTAGAGGSTAGGGGVSGASFEANAWSIVTVALVAFAPLLLALAM